MTSARHPAPPTLVLLAHGSRNPAGTRTVECVTDRVRLRLPGVEVRTAYVAPSRPRLADVLVGAGADVVVVPLMCSPDAPPPDAVTVAERLGPDRLLAGVLHERLRDVGARPGQPVLMVAPGTEPASARRDALRSAQLLEERWRGPVRTANLTGLGPRMSEVVADLRRRDLALPAVVPYLLAPGHFWSLARDRARSLGLDLVADVVGDHPHVAEAVARRYRATSAHRFAVSLGA